MPEPFLVAEPCLNSTFTLTDDASIALASTASAAPDDLRLIFNVPLSVITPELSSAAVKPQLVGMPNISVTFTLFLNVTSTEYGMSFSSSTSELEIEIPPSANVIV